VENTYYGKDIGVPVIKPKSVLSNNLFSSALASRSGQSPYDPDDMSSNEKEYLMPKNVAETTARRSDHTVH